MICPAVGFILSDSGNTTRGVQLPNEKIGCEKVRCITKLTSSEAPVKQFYIPIEKKILMESSFRLTCEPGVSRSPENVRGIITLKASIMRLAVPRFMISEHPFPWLFHLIAMLPVFVVFPLAYNIYLSFYEFAIFKRLLIFVGWDNRLKLFATSLKSRTRPPAHRCRWWAEFRPPFRAEIIG